MSGIFAELNRRNVTRVAIAYAVAAWVLTEVSSVLLPTFGAPEWVLQVLVALLILGFPVALVIAWVYELTPEGIKRESQIERDESISAHTGRKLSGLCFVQNWPVCERILSEMRLVLDFSRLLLRHG